MYPFIIINESKGNDGITIILTCSNINPHFFLKIFDLY